MMWERTRHGGYRRTGVVQSSENAARTRRRSVGRIHPPVQIKWRERLGLPECPYLIRWRIETPLGSVRLHHWLGPDDDRAFHDHPWWFVTLVLRGGYTDRNPAGGDRVRAGSVRYRPALHRHTVVPDPGGAWTLLVTGRPVRRWGFWPDGKFRKANKWFLAYGHHPCDSMSARNVHRDREEGTLCLVNSAGRYYRTKKDVVLAGGSRPVRAGDLRIRTDTHGYT